MWRSPGSLVPRAERGQLLIEKLVCHRRLKQGITPGRTAAQVCIRYVGQFETDLTQTRLCACRDMQAVLHRTRRMERNPLIRIRR